MAEPSGRFGNPQLAMLAFVSQLAFWMGAFPLAWVLRRYLSRLSVKSLRAGLLLCWWLLLALTHAYFLALWGFILVNRRLPNPDAVVFLLDNASRVPHHLLQTAPLLSLAFLLGVLFLSWTTNKALMSLRLPVLEVSPRRTFLAGVLGLVAAFVVAPGGVDRAGAAFMVRSASDRQMEARALQHIASLGLREETAMGVAPSRKYPVIVILVESLRHDLLTRYPEAIPFLKSLHDRHIGFDYAYATASHSNLTDLAFWYGQYPLRGSGFEGFPVDAPWRGTSMFKAFHDAGYETAYVSSQNELWGNMHNWLRTPDVDFYFHSEDYKGTTWENQDDLNGLVRLIQQGVATAGKVEDSETIATALRWIDKRSAGDGFFLGMNLQNTHFSYVMPPDAVEPYQPSDLGFRAVYYRWPAERSEQVRNRYLNAVYNVDRLLERFAAELKRRGLWDECLFVVLGDNGEAFYEHGFGNHSGPMYDEVVRTLALIKPPGSSSVQKVNIAKPVSHIDIAASVPVLAGLPLPASFQGRPGNLVESNALAPVYMYSNAIVRQYGIVDWPWKLLVTEYPEERTELYKLDADPAELNDLHGSLPRETNFLRNRLASWAATQRAYYARGAYVDRNPPRYSWRLPGGMAGTEVGAPELKGTAQ
jgi:arylsulfatase A-like enzyme